MKRGFLLILVVLCAVFLTAQGCQINTGQYNEDLLPTPDIECENIIHEDDFCLDATERGSCDADGLYVTLEVCLTGSECADTTHPSECVVISSDLDTDGDGILDSVDTCEGHDDTVDTDGDGTPDGCDVLSVPVFCDNKVIGTHCDSDFLVECDGSGVEVSRVECFTVCDGDFGSSTCEGGYTVLDTDGDGILNENDVCPGFDEMLTTGVDSVACIDWDGDGLVGMDDWPICQSTDGYDSSVQGTVTGLSGSLASPNYVPSLVETCVSSTEVEELSCIIDNLFYHSEIITCGAGEACENGACVASLLTSVCIDSDGVDFSTFGSVTLDSVTTEDYCTSSYGGYGLREQTCSGEVSHNCRVDSEYCYEGKCVVANSCDDPDETYSTSSWNPNQFDLASYESRTTVNAYYQNYLIASETDSCRNSGNIEERYCDGLGGIKTKFTACPTGLTCVAGECVSP
jgi:hypothetical protein